MKRIRHNPEQIIGELVVSASNRMARRLRMGGACKEARSWPSCCWMTICG
jgi:hypothetical protein